MSNEEEKWMEEVFQSMKGSQRAQPQPAVLKGIEARIAGLQTGVVSLRQWRYAAAAAVLLLGINIFALRQFKQSNELNESEMVVSLGNYDQSIVSDYKIYE